ncbi:MAG: NAD(P)H-dependent oxidoreductase subunit E [Deltaproteobacteria bacterium]|nr:NAD(P)H-dependent oxidoreductase subunit E [Deltaproteobacteria bacterium]
MELKEVDQVLREYGYEESAILPILQDIQDRDRYLAKEVCEHIAEKLSIPVTRVHRLATFYRAFSLTPRGRHLVSCCMGTACHVRGAPRLLDKLEMDLGIESGGTTKDLMFSLESVNCLGACATGPLVVIDGHYYGHMSSIKIDSVLKEYKKPPKGEKDEGKAKKSGKSRKTEAKASKRKGPQ